MTPDSAPSAKLTDPGSWNKYAYVGGDPINRTDSTGQDWYDDASSDAYQYYSYTSDSSSYYLEQEYDEEAFWSAYLYLDSLQNTYNYTVSLLQPLQDNGLIDSYSVDFWSGQSTLTLSPDYLQFFDYLQDCGCRPIDWGGAWDDIAGAIKDGTLVIRNLPILVVASLQALFKATPKGIGKPTHGLPTGTKPIDQMGWDHEKIEGIKGDIGAEPNDWVGVDPNGNVWTGSPSGDPVNHGTWN